MEIALASAMMFLQKGERRIASFRARLRHGTGDIHVSNMRIVIEEHKLGCIMTLGFDEMETCSLEKFEKKDALLTLRHTDSRYIEIHAKDIQGLADAINAAHASYKSALIKIGAVVL